MIVSAYEAAISCLPKHTAKRVVLRKQRKSIANVESKARSIRKRAATPSAIRGVVRQEAAPVTYRAAADR